MHRYAVFGHPIAHSKSPWIHAQFAAQFGFEQTYEAIDAPPERFEETLWDFGEAGGLGGNVTLPLKEFYNSDNQPDREKIARKEASLMRPVTLNGGKTFTVRSVAVMPESIPAGYSVLSGMDELDSLLIIDLGGPRSIFRMSVPGCAAFPGFMAIPLWGCP
mgnify:CR=1 FL=1